ncbi:MAG: biotin--[acetyl-CoA-carboxylase] ligase [Gammaproteobacteria bacterium]|nr:biotin--[acetyl-CoA-carboxylase] ligase [Gammaproteobacteria bacterium]
MDFERAGAGALATVFEELASRRVASIAGLDRTSLDQLQALGVLVRDQAVLDEDVDLLSATTIREALTPASVDWLRELAVHPHIGSTNTALLGRLDTDGVAGRVVTAEVQTAGRGRRGRAWLSPFGRNLAVSIGVAIDRPSSELGALSLVVGLAVRDALLEYGLKDIDLKWPNDVLMYGAKLAGILIELAQPNRPAELVIGIGVNVGCRQAIADRVGQAVADVAEQVEHPSRNRLLAALVNHVVAACGRFAAEGFVPFRAPWDAAHHYHGRTVTLTLPGTGSPGDTVSGTVLGVAGNGALRIASAAGVREYIAGEVSLRAAGETAG